MIEALLDGLRRLQLEIRDRVVAGMAEDTDWTDEVAHEHGDTIYRLDRLAEGALVDRIDALIAPIAPVRVVCEGMGVVDRPSGSAPAWRLVLDPVDGTRGLMYGKRSAWVLGALAPERGDETSLRDVVAAAMSEIPTPRQHLCDAAWAVVDGGARAERHDLVRSTSRALALRPSTTPSAAGGFGQVARFVPGRRDVLAAIDDEVVADALGPASAGRAQCFEDQYLSSGGQLYELMAGRDRWVADLRPLVGLVGISAHPYDLCTELVAREAGVLVGDPFGDRLDVPLDLESPVAWAGYANAAIRDEIQPALLAALRRRGLSPRVR